MNYVIIGNSTAAIGCIEGIRQIDTTGSITVISREKYHTYSRPLISYLLYGKTDEEGMKYRSDSFYEEANCNLLLGRTVCKILPEQKQIQLDDDSLVPYDQLLVASGSDPLIPPLPGLVRVEKLCTFMSLDDAKKLESFLYPEARVLILGAGLIGLKCAEGIVNKVNQITIVDLAGRILPNILDEDAAKLVQEHVENKGIEFILADSVQACGPKWAELKSGKRVEFDVLVIAAGVRPNTRLVLEAGGLVNRGIVTDLSCLTSLDDVYAAGDCAESFDVSCGENKVLALLPNAYMQGECAGINMAGGSKLYNQAIPMNAIGLFGLHIITAGSYTGQDYIVKKEGSYKRLVTKDGLLKGYILVGDVARAGIYTALIKEKKPLAMLDFELIRDKPQLMAFSKKERQIMLGGRVS